MKYFITASRWALLVALVWATVIVSKNKESIIQPRTLGPVNLRDSSFAQGARAYEEVLLDWAIETDTYVDLNKIRENLKTKYHE